MLKKILVLVLAVTSSLNAYSILVIFPMPSKSHGILGGAIVDHLVNAGHNVTYIAAVIPSKPHPNVTVIDVSDDEWLKFVEKMTDFKTILKNELGIYQLLENINHVKNYTAMVLNNPNIRTLIYDNKIKIDLVIVEWMFTETYIGFAALFECPYIWFSSVEPHWGILSLIDEYPNPSYHTDIQSSSIPPFTFLQRVKELAFQLLGFILRSMITNGIDLGNYNEYIAPAIIKKGRFVPSFEELKYNASMVFGNSHVSLGIPTRVPENYKHIGGYHIDKNVKPLPEDLKQIMDNAKYGIIYFSMGSHLQCRTLPTELKQNLLKMFSSLKQTILWKFEENLPNLSKNIHILKWAPQQSILAHPNLLLFITHGGHLSTTESIHFGVPIIGIPVFGDQFVNVARAVKKGFAKNVDLSLDMADSLKEAIDDMLMDNRYREKVKELSAIYHDRPVSPSQELVHWVEHVIKTNGAPHMRSPSLAVPWYQKLYLDLVFVIVFTSYCISYSFKRVIYKFRIRKDTKRKLN